jgi:hypothetical protein
MPRKVPLPYDAEAAREYRIKNKERMNALERERYQRDKEKILASQRRRYQLDRPNRLAYAKAYAKANREQVLAYKRRWSKERVGCRYKANVGTVWRPDSNIALVFVNKCSTKGCIWPATNGCSNGHCAYHQGFFRFGISLFDEARDFTFFHDLRTVSFRELIRTERLAELGS